MELKKQKDRERERKGSIPTSRYYAYMRRLCNLYFQQTMFGEMITIEQSIKHLVEYYQLRERYLNTPQIQHIYRQSPYDFASPLTFRLPSSKFESFQ